MFLQVQIVTIATCKCMFLQVQIVTIATAHESYSNSLIQQPQKTIKE